MNTEITIITGASHKHKHGWQNQTFSTWDAFIAWLDPENPGSRKGERPWIGGQLVDGTDRRLLTNLATRTMITADADHPGPDFLERVRAELGGIRWLIHSTASSTEDDPRWRIIIPLDRPVTPDEYRVLADDVLSRIGDDFDPVSTRPLQVMFGPATSGWYHHERGIGTDLPVGEIVVPERETVTYDGPIATTPDPYALAAVSRELDRLDELDAAGWDGEPWDSTTYAVACNLLELANSPWAGIEIADVEAQFLDRAPVDEKFGPREHEIKWNSAVAKIGNKGRAFPRAAASDDFDGTEGGSTRPEVNVSNPSRAADWLRHELGREGSPLAGFYRQPDGIVRVPRAGQDGYAPLTTRPGDDDGPAQVRSVDHRTVSGLVHVRYQPRRWVQSREAWVDCLFPTDVASSVMSVPEELSSIRDLAGVVHTPVVRSDGTLLTAPGYDPASGLLHLPDPTVSLPEIPERPTDDDVRGAVDLISPMLVDFPWNTESDRANYWALLLTPLLRTIAPPPYRLGVINAHQAGSGKSLLARILRTIHGGSIRGDVPEDGAEWRKQITAILTTTTGAVVQFDNVRRLASTQLDALLTSDQWEDRILGETRTVMRRNDRLWVATGNNVAIGGDLARRCLWVTIDPNDPHPEWRTEFTIKGLPQWVARHRGDIIAALLIMIRAWVVAGRPVGKSRGEDDYARWIETCQGILSVAGVAGTVAGAETVRAEIADEDEDWGLFLSEIWTEFGDQPWQARDVFHLDSTPDEITSAKSLGRWLKNRQGRWTSGFTVRQVGKGRLGFQWKVQSDLL